MIILTMTAQVLFLDVFFENDPHLNVVEKSQENIFDEVFL